MKTYRGKRIYGRRKETIERFFADARGNNGLSYACMLGMRNMQKPCFLTVAVSKLCRQ